MAYKLYSYFRSSCSWRVRIALALKGVTADLIPIHLVKNGGEQHSEGYREINPIGQLPTLDVGSIQIGQSVAICEYLEEKYPTPPLLPERLEARAKVREMVQVINSGIQPIQNLSVMQALGSQFNVERPATLEWSRKWISRGFEALESLTARSESRYLIGEEVTMADIFLVPQVYNAHRFSVDMARFPNLTRIDAELAEIPAFQTSHPSCQPDTPDELK